MLTDREKFKDIILAIARKLRFRPVIVEKDYYLTVILNNIETYLSDKIVFKGGTLLNKAHLNYHRLSEDLDFTYYAPLTTRSQRSTDVSKTNGYAIFDGSSVSIIKRNVSKAITPIRGKMPDFLKALKLSSDKPEGEGFNNSKQYVFKVKYPSVLMAKYDIIKIEI